MTQRNKRYLVWLVTLLAVIALVASVLYTRSAIKAKAAQKKPSKPSISKQVVAYLPLTPQRYVSRVEGFGEAQSRYHASLSSDVAGKVAYVANRFAEGQRVKKGQVLIKLEQQSIESAIASHEASLANAQLKLLEEKRLQQQARYEWRASGLSGQPDSPLFFREPQIRSAHAAIAAAKKQLTKSRLDLNKTAITSPFDAVITQTQAQPGSVIQAGAPLATLSSTDRMEVSIPLSSQQWAQLPSGRTLTAGKWPVILSTDDGTQTWRGYVIRVGKTVNKQTRQRPLVVAVERPYDLDVPLYAGSFVKARIDGKVMSNLWKIPTTALSQSGDIWLIDDNDCLTKLPLTESYSRDGSLYMPAPTSYTLPDETQNNSGRQVARLVLSPLNSFVVGMCVTPKAIKPKVIKPKAIKPKAIKPATADKNTSTTSATPVMRNTDNAS